MPQRRRVLLATASERKCDEVKRELQEYDIECESCEALPPSASHCGIKAMLHQRGESYWVKAVMRETTRVYAAPRGGLEEFKAQHTSDQLPTAELSPMCDGDQ